MAFRSIVSIEVLNIAAASSKVAEQVRLRAPRENGDDEVFLEDGLTLQAFFEFLDTLPIKRQQP